MALWPLELVCRRQTLQQEPRTSYASRSTTATIKWANHVFHPTYTNWTNRMSDQFSDSSRAKIWKSATSSREWCLMANDKIHINSVTRFFFFFFFFFFFWIMLFALYLLGYGRHTSTHLLSRSVVYVRVYNWCPRHAVQRAMATFRRSRRVMRILVSVPFA
jgi:hypothetical protein